MEMQELHKEVEELILLMGFEGGRVSVHIDEPHKKITLFIDDDAVRGERTPHVLSAFHHLLNQILRKRGGEHHIIDLNYYRRERERLITELTRAAARKASISKEAVELPPMNAYERRIVHMEIATHPELRTESEGLGKDRRVIIKYL